MPEASFYLLPTQTLSERYFFACKLIEKAYRSGQLCYIYTDNPEQSQQLDDLLWRFRQNSFVPHQVLDQLDSKIPDYEQTILIGHQPAPQRWQKLIFNLSSKYPDDLTQTERVLEILDNNEALKQFGRQRYRLYTEAGFKMTMYDMSN